MRAVSSVLPFRVNGYVIEELIDESRVPDDPIYRLTFPQRGMRTSSVYQHIASALRHELPEEAPKSRVADLRAELNPHPARQCEMNMPVDAAPLGYPLGELRVVHGLSG